MSQQEIQKENSQKPVFLSQGQNPSVVLSQGQVKSQLQVQSQNRVPSQVDNAQAGQVASQGQILTQAQAAPQEDVSSQQSVANQAQGFSSQPKKNFGTQGVDAQGLGSEFATF